MMVLDDDVVGVCWENSRDDDYCYYCTTKLLLAEVRQRWMMDDGAPSAGQQQRLPFDLPWHRMEPSPWYCCCYCCCGAPLNSLNSLPLLTLTLD